MNPVQRAFTAKVDDVDAARRTIVARISTNSVDRYNTCFDVRGCDLKGYQANRVVLWEHGKDVARGSLPIGSNIWVRVDRGNSPKMIAKTQFKKDDFSQLLFEAYRDCEMSGWSISALPTDFGKPTEQEIRSRPELADVEMVFRKFELCEYSAVSVPGNAECLTEDELRSLAGVISRGIPVPEDVKLAVERLALKPAKVESAIIELSNVGVEPVQRDATESLERAVDRADSEGDETDDEDVNRSTPEPEATVIELPPLIGRKFEDVFFALVRQEVEYREHISRKFKEQTDWLFGKV